MAKKKFIDIHVGEPGSLHDYHVFKRSALYTELENSYNPKYYLLADSAYALTSYLISPFKDYGTLTEKQKSFNNELTAVGVD